MVERIPCAVAIVRWDDDVLLLRRRDDDRSFPGTWCLPGGRKDEGDSDTAETAVRELFEETKIVYRHGRVKLFHTGESPHEGRDRIYVIDAYTVETDIYSVRLSDEHTDYLWVKPEEALKLQLAGNLTRRILELLR
jgi:8-oxo-dGTP pyrophosphatase MutT (NUDIX family)